MPAISPPGNQSIIKALAHNLSITAKEKKERCTFSRASSMASSLSFSLQPFFRILSQKVANNSALELPETPLLQKTSKASLSACGKNYENETPFAILWQQQNENEIFQLKTLWKSVCPWKHSVT